MPPRPPSPTVEARLEATFRAAGDDPGRRDGRGTAERGWRSSDDGVDARTPPGDLLRRARAEPRRRVGHRIFVDRDPTHGFITQLPAKRRLAAPADDDAKAELLLELEFYGARLRARAVRARARPRNTSTRPAPCWRSGRRGPLARRLRVGRRRGDRAARPLRGPRDFYRAWAASRLPRRRPSTPAARCSTTRWSPSRRSAARAHRRRVYIDQFKEAEDFVPEEVLTRLRNVEERPSLSSPAGRFVGPHRPRSRGRPARTCTATSQDARMLECPRGAGDVDVFVCARVGKPARHWPGNLVGACRHRGLRHADLFRRQDNMTRYSGRYTSPRHRQLVVQVVLRQYASLTEVLTCFDVDCCRAGSP